MTLVAKAAGPAVKLVALGSRAGSDTRCTRPAGLAVTLVALGLAVTLVALGSRTDSDTRGTRQQGWQWHSLH